MYFYINSLYKIAQMLITDKVWTSRNDKQALNTGKIIAIDSKARFITIVK